MTYLLLLVAIRRQKWIESSNTMFSLRSWTNVLDASGQWRAIYSPPVGEYCFAVLLSHQGFKVHNVTVRQISIPDNIDYPFQASPIKLTTLIVWQSRICPSLVSCRINPSVVRLPSRHCSAMSLHLQHLRVDSKGGQLRTDEEVCIPTRKQRYCFNLK